MLCFALTDAALTWSHRMFDKGAANGHTNWYCTVQVKVRVQVSPHTLRVLYLLLFVGTSTCNVQYAVCCTLYAVLRSPWPSLIECWYITVQVQYGVLVLVLASPHTIPSTSLLLVQYAMLRSHWRGSDLVSSNVLANGQRTAHTQPGTQKYTTVPPLRWNSYITYIRVNTCSKYLYLCLYKYKHYLTCTLVLVQVQVLHEVDRSRFLMLFAALCCLLSPLIPQARPRPSVRWC
jgi:hypothetical protein